MLLDQHEVARRRLCIPLNNDSVACLETAGLNKVVRMRLIRAPARARIGFDLCLLWLPVVNEPERFPFSGEEGKPILQDKHEPFLLLLRRDLLRINVPLHQKSNPIFSSRLFEPCAVMLNISTDSDNLSTNIVA